MKEDCPFLEDAHLKEGERCAFGVNYLNVGMKNSVPDLFKNTFRDLTFRSSVDLLTYFHNIPETSFIDVDFACLAKEL